MDSGSNHLVEKYLRTTKNELLTSKYANLSLVLGNESCDLDSAVSSIVYAIFLNWQHEQIKCKVCTRDKRPESFKDDIFVPILNVDKEDYEIKTEVAFCLKEHGIGKDSLVFRNEINLQDLTSKSDPKIILVDHHVLSKNDQHLAPFVTEIIDHRPIDKTGWTYKDDVRSTVQVVGSCCTLVTQRIRDLSTLMSKNVEFFDTFLQCVDMLYSTIILDTVNFSKELKKATPHDEEIVLFLEGLLKVDDCDTLRKTKLDSLVNARKDVSQLTAAQLLMKDVKIIADVMMPSFPLLVKEFLKRPKAMKALNEVLHRQNCNIALLLGMDLENGLKRDMAVYCPTDNTKAHTLCEFLRNWRPSLDLSADESTNLECYNIQNNLTASRKQYVPALMEYLKI